MRLTACISTINTSVWKVLSRFRSHPGHHGRSFSASRHTIHTQSLSADGRTRSTGGSVLRFDAMTGTWVVFSSGRRNRPKQTESSDASTTKIPLSELPDIVTDCPFCAGNEHMTPTVLLEHGEMRVVSNKYPAVAPLEDALFQEAGATTTSNASTTTTASGYQHHAHTAFLKNEGALLNNQIPALGFHEVVIESPYHNQHIATSASSSAVMARDLLTVFRDRGLEHRVYEDIEHTVFFKNHGSTAGASLIHPHSQIVSTPVVPVEAQRLQSLALEYFKTHRRSLYEQIIAEELAVHNSTTTNISSSHGSRVVDMTDNFLALVPYASSGPYVINILPRFHASGLAAEDGVDSSDFTSLTDDLLDECAQILRSCLYRLHVHLDDPDFNLVVQTAPVPQRGVQAAVCASAFFRWYIRITPRLGAGAMAGFELGSGLFSNANMPEEDAQELRAVAPPLLPRMM